MNTSGEKGGSSYEFNNDSEWKDTKPGFTEIDLVGRDGGNARGDFNQTVDLTDVCAGWTETRAVKNKAQMWVFNALKRIRRDFPFPLHTRAVVRA